MIALVAVLALASPRAPQVPTGPYGTQSGDLFTRLAEGRKSEDPKERKRAYKRFASEADGLENAPLPRATRALGAGLEDRSYDVRETVLGLLLERQAPQELVTVLLEGYGVAWGDWRKLDKTLREMNDRRGHYSKDSLLSAEETEVIASVPGYVELVYQALGKVPDPKTERALVKALKRSPNDAPGRFFVAAARAGCDLGSRKSVGAAVDCLLGLGKALERGKVDVRYPREGPARLMDAFLAGAKQPDGDDFEAIALAISDAARARDITSTPAPNVAALAQWKAWWKDADSGFDASPRKLAEPVRATLEMPEKKEDAAPQGRGRGRGR